jgi:hypothetical protein
MGQPDLHSPALAGGAARRFCGPRLFRSDHRHRALFYRGVETPAPSFFGNDFVPFSVLQNKK